YKTPEIAEELAKGLYNAIQLVPVSSPTYYHTTLLAYTMRYYLPKDSIQTTKKRLEDLTINLTKQKIIEAFTKKVLRTLIEDISSIVEETELILLINEAIEGLPYNIQNATSEIMKTLETQNKS
ncbi:MAG: hypothetical protein WBA22_19515, partial [Candidatus Methanofastidiosia archaeon]